MPGAQRDHDHVLVAPGRPQPVLGQRGEIGVVLDHDPAAGQALADEHPPVHPVRLGKIGREAQPALAVDHAGRPDADRPVRSGDRGSPRRGHIELGHHVGDGVRHLDPGVTRRLDTIRDGRGRSGVGTRASATITSEGLSAIPRTLVPPMSIPNATPASADVPAPEVTTKTRPAPSAPAWPST